MTKGKYIRTPEIKEKNKNSLLKILNSNNYISPLKGIKRTQIQKERMREIKIKLYEEHPEIKEIIKNKLKEIYNSKNYINSFFGKHHSQETKDKISKANKDYLKNHKHPMKGKHHLEKSKIKMSESKKGKYSGKNNPRYGKVASHSQRIYLHFTPFQGEIKMHKWEHLYANYLDSIGELYLYEPDYFEMNINGKDCSYTPDFLLPIKNTFVEIKGYWRDDAKLKSNKFREEWSNYFNYEILFKKDLQKLGVL